MNARALPFALLALTGCALSGDLAREVAEPDGLRAVRVERADDPDALKLKLENAHLIAEIERVKAQAASDVYRAKGEATEARRIEKERHDIELAALKDELARKSALAEEREAQAIYPASKMTLAVLAAALACAVYAYKRMSIGMAVVGLTGIFAIYAAVLAGQIYPRYVAAAPLPLLLAVLFACWRYGVLKRALVACVRGVELTQDNRAVKTEIVMQPGASDIEIVRDEIDAATVQRARRDQRERRP